MWLSITDGASQCQPLIVPRFSSWDLTEDKVAAVVPARLDNHVERELLAPLQHRRRVQIGTQLALGTLP
jgi:hypothetical protein